MSHDVNAAPSGPADGAGFAPGSPWHGAPVPRPSHRSAPGSTQIPTPTARPSTPAAGAEPTADGGRAPDPERPDRAGGTTELSAARRAFSGVRQITIANPTPNAGKTVATVMLAFTFAQIRGEPVLAWDNDETHAALSSLAHPPGHCATVWELLRDIARTENGSPLRDYLRSSSEAAFAVLASGAARADEVLSASAFRRARDVISQHYRLILVDTGDDVTTQSWQAAMDATDQLVIPVGVDDGHAAVAESALRLLDQLDQRGRHSVTQRAVVVVTEPAIPAPAGRTRAHRELARRCRAVCRVPPDPVLGSRAPLRYSALSAESRRRWLRVVAAVADGL